MCRFIAYLGPEMTLGSLLVEPAHSLLHQSWAPRHQRYGTVNADGFGVAWYDRRRRPEPALYRRTQPMWTDRSFASLAGVVASPAVLGAVRSATPPAPVEETGTPPFTSGPWAFAHNGVVEGFGAGRGTALRRSLSARREAGVLGASDSEVVFALVLDRLDEGQPPGPALESALAALEPRGRDRLNLVLTDGRTLAALAWGDTLVVRESQARDGAQGGGAGVTLASEPCGEDGAWRDVPDRSLVEAGPATVAVRPVRRAGGVRR